MADSPWYADPTTVDSGTGGSPASNSSSSNTGSGSVSSGTQNKISQIRKLPAGKNRVEQVLGLVHELDPREYNSLVESLTIEEQDELTQRLLKIRKKKSQKKQEKNGSWYLTNPDEEDEERSALSIIFWWEKRRIVYNLMVGGAGIITMLAMIAVNRTSYGNATLEIIAWSIAYGIAANICYTGGWISELISRRIWAEKARYFGTIALALGTAFSILLTLSPLALIAMVLLVRLIRGS